MDVSKFRRSTNIRDVRGQPLPAATVIVGHPAKEAAKKPSLIRDFENEAKEAMKRWERK